MTKLTYKKIGDGVIQIDLLNGYSIIAIELFNYETKKYEVAFCIKGNTVGMIDSIEELEKIEFDATYKTINSAILKYVATLLSNGFLDYYIKRYKYMLKCFDKGDEIFERERMEKANAS